MAHTFGDNGLIITDDRVHLHLTDGAKLKLADGTIAAGDQNISMLEVGSNGGAIVQGFRLTGPGHIDGNRVNNADEVNNPLIKLWNVENPVFENLTIRDLSCRAIKHDNGSGLRINNCRVENFGEGVLWATPDAKITHTDFINSHLQDALEPLSDGDDFLIEGGVFRDIKQSAIDCYGGTDGHIVGVKIDNTEGYGIGAVNGSERITIDDCTVINGNSNQNDLGAVWLRETGCKLTNSDVIADGTEPRAQKGVSIESSGCLVDDCLVKGWYNSGIKINGVDDCTVRATTVKNNNQGGSNLGAGIRTGDDSAANNLRLINNHIHDDQATKTQEYAILMRAGDGHIINENDLRGNISNTLRFYNYAPNDVHLEDNIGAIDFAELGTGSTLNGMGSETANAETPTAATWRTGDKVDFTDSGDGSGNGVYLLLPDGTWSQVGPT